MSEKVALLDMDGTVADYHGGIRKVWETIKHPSEGDEPNFQGNPWDEQRRHLISRIPGFWTGLDTMPDGFEILETLMDVGFRVNILTKGPTSKPFAWKEKVEWCQKHLPEDVQITITEDKGLSYGRILVDDWAPYFMRWLQFRPRGLVIVPAREWNRGVEGLHDNIYRYEGDRETLRAIVQSAFDRSSGEPLILPR